MLNVVMLNGIMLIVIMLNVVKLNVVKLNVVMLIVAVPRFAGQKLVFQIGTNLHFLTFKGQYYKTFFLHR